MKSFVVFLACAALSSAQFGAPAQPWNGQFANHINGQLVQDTPEVAAAKAQHATAFAQVQAQLPILPPEIRYQMNGVINPAQHQQNYNNVPQVQTHTPSYVPQPQQIQQRAQLAEEVPRSNIGEVPEVQAAREAHLKAVAHFNSILPPLVDARSAPQVPQVPVYTTMHAPVPAYNQIPAQVNFVQNGQFLQDTPEVAAAKAEHARLSAALG